MLKLSLDNRLGPPRRREGCHDRRRPARPAATLGQTVGGRWCGGMRHTPRSRAVDFLRPGDLVVANDAATLPASLSGRLVPSGYSVEVRLAGRRLARPEAVRQFAAVVFGAGDYHTRTEDRPPPPPLGSGDRIRLGASLGNRRATAGPPASRVVAIRRPAGRGLGRHRAARPADPVRATSPSLWLCGTCGRRSPGRRSRSRRRRPALLSIGGTCRLCADRGGLVRDPHARGRHLVHRRQ